MTSDVTIMRGPQSETSDDAVEKAVRFLGLQAQQMDAADSAALRALHGTEVPGSVILASCEAVQAWLAAVGGSVSDACDGVAALLIYGWRDSAACRTLLRQLGGENLRLQARSGSSCSITVLDARDVAGQMAGLRFDVTGGGGGVDFLLEKENPLLRPIILRDGHPFFLQLAVGRTEIYLWGTQSVASLDGTVKTDNLTLPVNVTLGVFEALAPLLMFLRRRHGGRCWHAPAPRALFLIDDPLLRPTYGFLNYSRLVESMERHDFTTSIAFIPWNYRRTRASVAKLFQSHADRLSLCVHGCDHTRAEFATGNERKIRYLLKSALWQMEQHQRRWSVPFDNVMVFPQGIFSQAVMKGLKQSRFVAVINTTAKPVDAEENALRLEDLVEPAVTHFGNFPLFLRRYAGQLAAVAFDLFLGKPALIVEHHEYFRNGYGPLEEYVAALNRLDGALTWSAPATVCKRASLEKAGAGATTHVRFYTDSFVQTNPDDAPRSYLLHRRAFGAVKEITGNGTPLPWEVQHSYITVPVELPPKGTVKVIIERPKPAPEDTPFKPRLLHWSKVLVRRHLSEFRDNYLDKNPAAERFARRALNLVRGKKQKLSKLSCFF